MTKNEKADFEAVAKQINETIEATRSRVGELVREFSEAGHHPLGLASSFAMCAATVVATAAACGKQPEEAFNSVLGGIFTDAANIGIKTYGVLSQAMAQGLSHQEVQKRMEEMVELINKERAGEQAQ